MNRRSTDQNRNTHFQVEESTFYENLFLRTNLLLTEDMQQKLKNARVAIIGVGGIGGIAAEMIVRCGVGNIGLSDIECFEPTNLNRQLFSNFDNSYSPNRRISDKKANIAAERMKQINPFCHVDVVADGINHQNVEDFCKKYDCLICQPDKESIKVLVHRIAKKYAIPVVTASRTNYNGNRWTLAAKVWDYQSDPELNTFEETNHPELLQYSLEELTAEVTQNYDLKDRDKVRKKWSEIIDSGESVNYGLVEKDDALKIKELYPDFFHKSHILAPIANIAGAMASIQVIKLLLGYPIHQYAVDFWNGEIYQG